MTAPWAAGAIDPSLAQGDNAFAVPGFGPTPISAPFYDYVLGSTEYRVWLSADTGYPVNISAALPVGTNARTGLVWSTSAQLCDTVTRVGTCGPQLFLRNSLTSGVADATYTFIAPRTGTTLMCDWDGNGTDTPGVFVGGTWYVTNSTNGGGAQSVFGYGQPGDIPVCGDWDGNGTDTPGIVRGGVWYLTNTLGSPFADVHFGYGNGSGDTPVVGDWDGNGTDTPGVYRAGHWYLVNSLNKPMADLNFGYGNPTDHPGGGRLERRRPRHAGHRPVRGLVPGQHLGPALRRRVLLLRRGRRSARRRALEPGRAVHRRRGALLTGRSGAARASGRCRWREAGRPPSVR